MTMKCKDVRRLLVAYLDGELAPKEQEAVRDHLAECTSCREELAALASTREQIGAGLQAAADEVAPSPRAWARLQARLAQEVSLKAGHKRLVPPVQRPKIIKKGSDLWMRRRVAFTTGLALLIAISVVAFVPPIRAQVGGALATWFHFGWKGAEVEIGGSSPDFTPIEPSYLPESLDQQGGTAMWGDKLLLSFFGQDDQFLVLTESKALDRRLPPGQKVTVNGRKAVLLTGQSGTVEGVIPPWERPLRMPESKVEEIQLPPECLEALAPQPGMEPAPKELPPECEEILDKIGGGVTVEKDANGVLHAYRMEPIRMSKPEMKYDNATKLIWYIDNTRIELLSNLPQEEILKVASSMRSGGSQVAAQGTRVLQVASVTAYPNPVSVNAGAVHFVVEGQGIESIKVEIYDLKGTPVYDSGLVGGNELAWHLQDMNGDIVANGTYLYVVTTQGYNGELIRSEVQKLVVLR